MALPERDTYEDFICGLENDHDEEVAKHFKEFWQQCDFESIFDALELHDAITPLDYQAIGKKLVETYLLDLEESGLK